MTTNKAASTKTALLTFRLGTQVYALHIADVLEVAAMVELITLPDAPYGALGFANRHGAALPVLDLRMIFDVEGEPISANTLLIVTQHRGQLAGWVVDEVYLVEYVVLTELRTVPSVRKYIHGIVQDGDRLIQLITLPPLFAAFVPQGNNDERHVEGKA